MSHSHDHQHAPPPMADASVRTGRPNDAPALGMVQAAVFRSSYADVLPARTLAALVPETFAHAWRTGLSNPPSLLHRVLVACAGDQVVGFAALVPATDTDSAVPQQCGEVSILGVHPDARRSGHGSRLLNASADTLRANDMTSICTWVLASDEAARVFCAGAGLEPDGAWRERVVGADDQVAREVRLTGRLRE